MFGSPSALGVLLASLLVAGCSGADVTIDELADGQYTNQQDVIGVMDCESWGMASHHQWTPDFDDEAALAVAVEHAPALEAQRPVSTVRQIGQEIWAIGDADGVAIGVVEAFGAVVFCHQEDER